MHPFQFLGGSSLLQSYTFLSLMLPLQFLGESSVSLILASDTRILFSGATLTIGSGASISPYIRIEEGSTLKGLYSSISLASTNAASGQRIVPAVGIYSNLESISIGSGVCLYLSSGTQLTFTDQLLIRGTLQASGVTFTKYNGYSSWYGIYMESSSSSSYLNNCTIQYGIYGLYIDNCSPTISGTDINNCIYGVMLGSGSNPSFENGCEITNNRDYGIVVFEDGLFSAYYCLISENGDGTDADGICNLGESYIRYCQISDNNFAGIEVLEDSWADLGYDSDDGMGFNAIGNNTVWDVKSWIEDEVPAYYNYWGSEDGPNTDKLYGDIGYAPWYDNDYHLPWGLGKKVASQPIDNDLSLYREGVRKMQSKDYENAGELFSEFMSLYPDSYYWRFAMNRYVQIMHILNKDDEAERIFTSFEKSKLSDKNKSYMIGIKADFYRKNGLNAEAVDLLNAACTAASDSVTRKRFKFQLAQTLYDLGDTSSVIAAYRNFISEYPNDIHLKIIKAELVRFTGEVLTIRTDPKENPVVQVPTSFKFVSSSPNPFNISTTLRFDLPEEAKVEIVVYDLMGREIWKTARTNYIAGTHSLVWNGTNNAGQIVGTGMYLIRLISPKFHATQKVVLMK